MSKIVRKSWFRSLTNKLGSKQSKSSTSNKPQIRDHHWILGSIIILAGSWITHTTTATIALPKNNIIEPVQGISVKTQGIEHPAGSISTNETTTPNVIIPEEIFTTVRHKIKKGESLGIIFRKRSLDMSLPYFISKHDVAKQLVSLSIGKELEFKFDETKQLRKIRYPVSALKFLDVSIDGKQITNASVEELPFTTAQKTVSGEISSSLYLSALDAGLSNNLIMEMVRVFGWDIDFVLDIRRGDSFHVVHTEYLLDDKKLADGDILAAEFTTQGHTYRAIRFEDDNGNASFYTPEGESMLGTFLRSPVEFSRISSRFGKRKHPISKKWKTHKGVDYAASRGTPIRATADGKVLSAGRKGGYGNTVILSHAGRFSTLYAHMKGFAKGVRSKSRVKQGQIIGYVGTTGYSTGPHLHYEFRVDGVHRNSLTYKTPKASSIKKEFRAKFNMLASDWSNQLSDIKTRYKLAKASAQKNSITSTL